MVPSKSYLVGIPYAWDPVQAVDSDYLLRSSLFLYLRLVLTDASPGLMGRVNKVYSS